MNQGKNLFADFTRTDKWLRGTKLSWDAVQCRKTRFKSTSVGGTRVWLNWFLDCYIGKVLSLSRTREKYVQG
jgi:hypothetical protein